MKKIYSKITKERKEAFQIETSILVSGDTRVIRKSALKECGKKHILQMSETYEIYKELDILCKSWNEQGDIYFEFLEGETYSDYLVKCFESGNREMVDNAVERYLNLVSAMMTRHKGFDNTDKGSEVFGEKYVCDRTTCFTDQIFDLTFDNVIVTESGEKIIDYEWRFDFPVDVSFIKYRAVLAFWMNYGHMVKYYCNVEELYNMFGVDQSKIETYNSLNDAFVRYIYGDKTYEATKAKYKKRTIDMFRPDIQEFMRNYIRVTERDGYYLGDFGPVKEILDKNEDMLRNPKGFFPLTQYIISNKNCFLLSDEYPKEMAEFVGHLFDEIRAHKVDIKTLQSDLAYRVYESEQRKAEIETLIHQLSEANKKLDYLKTCKAYNLFLKKKFEEQFGDSE